MTGPGLGTVVVFFLLHARGVKEQSRALLLDRLPELGWTQVAPADGAFYLYADISASGSRTRPVTNGPNSP